MESSRTEHFSSSSSTSQKKISESSLAQVASQSISSTQTRKSSSSTQQQQKISLETVQRMTEEEVRQHQMSKQKRTATEETKRLGQSPTRKTFRVTSSMPVAGMPTAQDDQHEEYSISGKAVVKEERKISSSVQSSTSISETHRKSSTKSLKSSDDVTIVSSTSTETHGTYVS